MKHQNNDPRPSRLPRFATSAAFGLITLFLAGANARATNYAGNGNTGFDGAVGKGILQLTDDGTNISGALTAGGPMNDCLVIYIDTGAGGGFTNTAGFSDTADGNRKAISGFNGGSARSLMTFSNGFAPQYALALGPNDTKFGGLWALADGGSNSLPFLTNVNLLPLNNTGPYTFSFAATNIGLTPGVQATIKIFGTYISDTAYRSTEAIAGNDSGAQGVNPFVQLTNATYTFDAPTATLTPVTFQVDMTAMLTNGFNPGNGDSVSVSGSFLTNATVPFPLTNNPNAANTNVYSGTCQDQNPTNTDEVYKFNWVSVSGDKTNAESSDNRPFTLQSGGQTLDLVYFSDFAPTPSFDTNSVTFQVDMTAQLELNNFDPSSEQVEVYGTFNQFYEAALGVPVQWTTLMGVLTNNPNAANTNLYSGTFPDQNYPGTFEQYKFIIVNNSVSTYESIANRDFITPNGFTNLPVVFFNDQNDVVTVPVTFQVDMTAEEANLTTNGTTVNASVFGFPGFTDGVLTNNPNAANPNIYSGTFSITGQIGTAIAYKYTIILNEVTNYEQPLSEDNNNRSFILSATGQTLPLVFWSDQNPDNLLPVDTQVTFTINMTNVVDENGVAFDPNNDAVFINGTFLPGGFISALWTDPDPSGDFTPSLEMTEVGLTSLYSATFTVQAGSPLDISYKYGIWHGASGGVNTGTLDNEAPPNENHTRYIRAVPTYSMPVDTFGQQVSDPAAANEISFGDLAASNAAGGSIALNWLGRPGVFLQMSTNLASGVWTTVTNSGAGLSASNFPSGGSNVFFRLVNPSPSP